MNIRTTTTWTVGKEGGQLELTLEDLQQLLIRLAASGDLIVSDEASSRSGSGEEEIGISMIGDAIKVSLRSGENTER
jgi:hypothetical protein